MEFKSLNKHTVFLTAVVLLWCFTEKIHCQTANNAYTSAPSVTLNSSVSTCSPSPLLNATGAISVSGLGTATHDGPASGYCITSLGTSCRNMWIRFTVPAGVYGITIEGISSGSAPSGSSTASVCLWRYASSTWTCYGAGGGCSNSSIIANYSGGLWSWSRTRRMNVTPGQTYYLEIGTYSATTNFNFNFRVISYGATPANISCATAIPASGVQCNNGSVAPDFGAPLCWLYNENSVYFTISAPSSDFTLQASSISCDAASSGYLQMAIYSSCPSGCSPSPSYLGCDVGSGGSPSYPAEITINSGVSAGQLLYVIIDGDAGAVCQWTFNLINNSLPVELTDYQGYCQPSGVKLKWVTSSEINNNYFIIEKSVDMISWTYAGIVPGSGTVNTVNEYEFIDNHFEDSYIVFYKLIQVDYDGKHTQEGITTVTSCEGSLKMYYSKENDNNGFLNLKLENDQKLSLSITSILGQCTMNLVENKCFTKGEHKISIPEWLPKGIYIIKSIYNNENYSSKIVLY